MNTFKIIDSNYSKKKVLYNRVNSVPTMKSKYHYMLNTKQMNPNPQKLILIKRHILNNKKSLFNKNPNRSMVNIIKEELKEIKEKDNTKKIKKINPLMNNLILPEMNITNNIINSKNKTMYNNTSLDIYLKKDYSNKGGKVMDDEELILLLKAKCKDIGINFRENMFLKFKEFCNSKCKNRIADFAECNFGLNCIRIISVLLLDTNRLSRLDLTRNNIGNIGVEILVNALKNSKSLVSLNLSSNSISHKGGQNIFSSFIYQQSIVDLNLASLEGSNRNRITEVGIQDMPKYLKNNHFIEMLNLSGNSIKNEGFFYICEGLEKNQSLQYLDVSNNGINKKGIKKGLDIIIKYEILSKISNLNISYNPITTNGIILLASNMKNFPNLISLNIAYCGLEFKGFQSLLKTVQYMKKLENLNVSGNNLKTDIFYILKEYFAVFGLRNLNLSRCLLGDKGAYYLGECISSNESLKYLNISGNSITDSGFKGFVNIFKFNKCMEFFDCSCNFITNNTARNFVKSLYNNIHLKSINFHDNQLNDEIGGDILDLLENNKTLIYINLSYNRIQTKTTEDINKKLKINYEKSKNDIIPEIERNIRDLDYRPEQFEILSKIIIDKRNLLKLFYKKLKEDEKNYKNIIINDNKKIIEEKKSLEKLKEQRKNVENTITEIYRGNDNEIVRIKTEVDNLNKKIQNEKILLKDVKIDNDILMKEYEKKKKEVDEKISIIENKLKLCKDKYNIAKNEYDIKDKEYIEKFKKYQDLLNPNLLVKIKKEQKEELSSSLTKFKINSKKLSLKNNNIKNKNNAYNSTTLSTGNTGKNNIEEKRSFKFNKKK